MVDASFLFVLLLGGALVGLVTGYVRRHSGLRFALDVIAGAIGGFLGTPLWIGAVRHVLPLAGLTPATAPPWIGNLFTDLYYLSPVLGGFLGVMAVALVNRLVFGAGRGERWASALGDLIRIVGIVYLVITACLTLALVAAAAHYGRWDVISPLALAKDAAVGLALILIGAMLARWAGKPQVQP